MASAAGGSNGGDSVARTTGVGMEFAGWSLKRQPPTVGVAMLSSSREGSLATDLYDTTLSRSLARSRSFCMPVRSSPPRFHARGRSSTASCKVERDEGMRTFRVDVERVR